MSSFEEMNLRPELLEGLEKMGYVVPSAIQTRSIGPLLRGRDVIGQAKTGSGKTAAFALPMLQAVDPRTKRVQALVLAPTRELALQITAEVRRLGAFTDVKLVTIYGGASINVQREALRHGVQIVVGTPGRVIDHIRRRWLDLSAVKFLVLDEADTMLDMGFIDDVEFILGETPKQKQMCLFSATMPQKITELSERYMTHPEKILIDAENPTVETLDHFYALVDKREKVNFLVELLQKEKPVSAIVFCRTKLGAHRLAIELQRRGFDTLPLHGNLSQRQRDYHMETFRGGRVDVLVATDVASRGIDVSRVGCVVNFDVPMDPLLYFHRVGRTARAGRAGKAFSLVSSEETRDFARILAIAKSPPSPMRPEDRMVAPKAAHEFSHSERRHGERHWRRNPTRPRWRRYR